MDIVVKDSIVFINLVFNIMAHDLFEREYFQPVPCGFLVLITGVSKFAVSLQVESQQCIVRSFQCLRTSLFLKNYIMQISVKDKLINIKLKSSVLGEKVPFHKTFYLTSL